MIVMKFGGSSVANAENIKKVGEIVAAQQNQHCLVVVSALGGVTDALIQTGQTASKGNEDYKQLLANLETRHLDTIKNLLPITAQSSCLSNVKQKFNELEDICEGVFRLEELSKRTLDRIISYGELLSSVIVSSYFNAIEIKNVWIDSRKLIITNSNFGFAQVNFSETNKNIQTFINNNNANLFVAPGFIASNETGLTTTLGRGGSDYTAAIFAAAIHANALEIWTDVTGMMTADPRWVSNAKTIPSTSYKEAMELSHFGAKVIYPPTIQPAMQQLIPIWIKNTFEPQQPGTVIENISKKENEIITGISSINAISLLSLEGSGMVGIPGFSKRLFEALSSANINVILITQSSSEHSICVAVNTADAINAQQVVDEHFTHEINTGKLEPLKLEHDLSIVALVGDKMKSHPGIAGKMFAALGRNGINIRAIAQGSSERNISAVVANKDVKKAVNVLHEAFFESSYKQLNLFIVGTGNVGSKLIEQINQQQKYLLENLNIQIRITGIGNSRHMLFNDEGIDLSKWHHLINEAPAMHLHSFVKSIITKNLRNSVLVDVTANEQVAETYAELLANSVAVVACNKIAAASTYNNYKKLKNLSREYNASYFFETNVGAGLPIIGTLNDLMKSGDSIHSIQAVLSGTLNYVFNHYDGKEPFAAIVKRAQDEGYTEPDPRLDLGGTDVMRKILILARESGTTMEIEEVENHSFLPASCMEGTVEDFYNELAAHELHFKTLYENAQKNNCKLKFVAEFKNGKAEVGLRAIPSNSDFYHLYGKDNIVLFYTKRYLEQPLVVKGAGAGADVTASGVFADIIRVAQ
ncbi:bifunctional aspartate kinase/homoserine dehydrogenase I [Hydrotalea sp.]|uniref:bifunctional aspartate kinase/homoserine dehydrogenase I n=1 Tax=Hydrotalea sp. TaxID=2881279 RepID=UPI003D0EF3F8